LFKNVKQTLVPLLLVTLTYNRIHSSHGATCDDDLIEHLMIIFEETYIQIVQGNLSAVHWNQVWRDFVVATSAQYVIKQCQDKITNIKKN
jgi:hypothetical protein